MEILSRSIFLSVLALTTIALLAISVVTIPMASARQPDIGNQSTSINRTDEFVESEYSTSFSFVLDSIGSKGTFESEGKAYYSTWTYYECYDYNGNGQFDNEWDDANDNWYVDEGEWDDANGDGFVDWECWDANGNGEYDEEGEEVSYNWFEAHPEIEFDDFDDGFDFLRAYTQPAVGSVSFELEDVEGCNIDSLYGTAFGVGDGTFVAFDGYSSESDNWLEDCNLTFIAQVIDADDADLIENYGDPGLIFDGKGVYSSGNWGLIYDLWSLAYDYGENDPLAVYEQALDSSRLEASARLDCDAPEDCYFYGADEGAEPVTKTLTIMAQETQTAKISRVDTDVLITLYLNAEEYECDSDGKVDLSDAIISGMVHVDVDGDGEEELATDISDSSKVKVTVASNGKKITVDAKVKSLESGNKDKAKVVIDLPTAIDCNDDADGPDYTTDDLTGKVKFSGVKITVDGSQLTLKAKKPLDPDRTGEIDYDGTPHTG